MNAAVIVFLTTAFAGSWSIPIQGAMSDSTGAPVHGTRNVTVSLYADPDEAPLLEVGGPMAFVDGAFTSWLSHDGSAVADFGTHPEWWLSFTLEGDVESDKIRIGMAPMANWSARAADADTIAGHAWSEAFSDDRPPHWDDLEGIPEDIADGDGSISVAQVKASLESGALTLAGLLSAAGVSVTGGGAISTTGQVGGGTGLFSGNLTAGTLSTTSGGAISTTGQISGGTGLYSGNLTAASLSTSGGAISTAGQVSGGTGLFYGNLTAASVSTSGGGAVTTTGQVSGGTGLYSGNLTAGSLSTSGGGAVTTTGQVSGGTGVFSGNLTAASLSTSGGGAITTTGAVNGGSLASSSTVRAQSSGGATCDSGRAGQIEFVNGQFRGCDGTDWRVLEMQDKRPIMKQSASNYTMAQVRSLTSAGGNWVGYSGSTSVCESGYHICTYTEAIVNKYAYSTSRFQFTAGQYFRTLGNYSYGPYAGVDHPHNAMSGYHDGGGWQMNGATRCASGAGPMFYIYSNSDRAQGVEWEGGCHVDDGARPWMCCINRSF
jgi:hypothetical protein